MGVCLTVKETRTLLQDVPQAYNTQINAIVKRQTATLLSRSVVITALERVRDQTAFAIVEPIMFAVYFTLPTINFQLVENEEKIIKTVAGINSRLRWRCLSQNRTMGTG
jgi:hypothetical protein